MALPARRIGIREARSQLGDLIQSVRQGAEWVITDRGRPVARLTAINPETMTLDDRLKKLETEGRISPAPHGAAPLPPPLPLPGTSAQELLREDRDR
jgi:prevent-host-death family protein